MRDMFHVSPADIPDRVIEMARRFDLERVLDELPESLPLGMRQRLSLAVAMVHKPELLILDEPTSGVDPVARDNFWRLLVELSRRDKVTIFISTHFMNEAERCDRMSLMHAGKVLVSDTPAELVRKRGSATLEEAFISYLVEAIEQNDPAQAKADAAAEKAAQTADAPTLVSSAETVHEPQKHQAFSFNRMFSYMWREMLELQRDPLRATLALLGSLILMFVIGFGISMDVEDLKFAVLDHDQSGLSQNYALNLSGSRYFVEQPPLRDYDDVDKRLRSGELALAIEIPPGFARDVSHGKEVEIGVWVNGAMPSRAETVKGYVQGMHMAWLQQQARERLGIDYASAASVETRFRYNPDVKSLVAMVPAVIPLLLLMLPAMLTALSVVREKELGSIINLYVTPVTRAEFLLGKQIPYVVLAMISFVLMVIFSIVVFDVPVKGSFLSLTLAALIYCMAATGFGLLASTFTRSQIAAMFFTIIGTLIPAIQFAGLINPVSSLEGSGRIIGELHPASYMLTISRGIFNKALSISDLRPEFWAMAISVPIILGLAIALLNKQER